MFFNGSVSTILEPVVARVKESCRALDLEHTSSSHKFSLKLYEVSYLVNKLFMSSGAKL